MTRHDHFHSNPLYLYPGQTIKDHKVIHNQESKKKEKSNQPIQSERAGCQAYISGTHYTANLFHRVQVRAKTSMHCKNLFINDGGNWQTVEAVGKSFP
jgi:hypothetical protein